MERKERIELLGIIIEACYKASDTNSTEIKNGRLQAEKLLSMELDFLKEIEKYLRKPQVFCGVSVNNGWTFSK